MSATVREIEKRPDPDVVGFLRDMLEQAEAGEIRGVLVVAQHAADVSWRVAGIEDRFRVTGYLLHAIHRLQED